MADALDLKSSEVNPSYRFKPGFRHQIHQIRCKASHIYQYRGVEQLVARRAHNPEVAGSSPVPATKRNSTERCCFSFGCRGKRLLATLDYETDERGSLGKHSERIRGMRKRGSAFRSGRKNQVSHANDRFFRVTARRREAISTEVASFDSIPATNNANRKRYRFEKPRNHNGFGLFSYQFSQLFSIDILSKKRLSGRT